MTNSTPIAIYNLLRNVKPTDLEIRDRSPGLTSRLLANQQMNINGITAVYKEPWRYLDAKIILPTLKELTIKLDKAQLRMAADIQ